MTYAIPLGSITTVGGTQYIGDDDDSSSDSHEPDEKQTHPPPTPAHGPTTSSPAKGGEGSYTLVKPILPSITDGTHDAIKDATLKSNDVAIRSVTGSGGSGLPAPPPTPATPNASDPSAVPGHSTVVNTASGLSNTEESGLSQSGLIAGIVVGSIALLVSIMALVYCCLLQRGYRSGEFECSEEVVLPGIEESQDVELTALPESSEAEVRVGCFLHMFCTVIWSMNGGLVLHAWVGNARGHP